MPNVCVIGGRGNPWWWITMNRPSNWAQHINLSVCWFASRLYLISSANFRVPQFWAPSLSWKSERISTTLQGWKAHPASSGSFHRQMAPRRSWKPWKHTPNSSRPAQRRFQGNRLSHFPRGCGLGPSNRRYRSQSLWEGVDGGIRRWAKFQTSIDNKTPKRKRSRVQRVALAFYFTFVLFYGILNFPLGEWVLIF